ncbi:hypothetical protein [Erwinia aphidicola]|uniref:hypothetical protein n=1 Tax=Erwinia aphidicola TaxID=68334 RepID=UPI0030CEFE45
MESLPSNGTDNIDSLTYTLNSYASLMGKTLQFDTLSDFEAFMDSDQPFTF